MKFLRNLFRPTSWGIIKIYRDLENYRAWCLTIKEEKLQVDSKFNKWNLKHNYFYTIYFMHDIEETEAQLPERIKRLRLIESLANLHRYLDEELGFAGSLVPSFNQFYDDDNKPTLTYLITYRFAFDKLSLKWILKWGILIAAFILIGNFYDLFNTIGTWIQTLI